MKKKRKQRITGFDVVNITFLTILMLLVLIPFYYTIIKSFMTQQEYIMNSSALFPANPTFDNFRDVFREGTIFTSFANSLMYTVFGTIYSMFITTTMAFALSKRGYPGRAFFQNLVVITMYFGGGLIPFFLTVKGLGMMHSRLSVIIPIGFNVFNLIIMRTFFEQLGSDLEEAATIDGASMYRIFWQIDLPLIKPALATVTLFFAVSRWNEWFYSSLFLANDQWPLQVILRQILWSTGTFAGNIPIEAGRQTFSEGIKAASVVITMVPIMLVYPFMQKYFVKGVMIGAVKS